MHDMLSVNPGRVKSLFRMDWHRMVHGKAFWIMAVIAAFIPVMMLTQMSGVKNIMTFVGGSESSSMLGGGMSLSILTVLSGILLSIFIGKEYTSGYIKNIITAHANKCDYIISKAMIAMVWNVAFTVIYLLTLFILGSVMGLPVGIESIPGFILYVLEKLLLSAPMSILMIAINLVFRRSYGWSIVFVCVAGTGVLVTSAQMGLQMLGLPQIASLLNYTITGASAFAKLTPSVSAFFVIIAVSAIWGLICTMIADCLMNKRDVL